MDLNEEKKSNVIFFNKHRTDFVGSLDLATEVYQKNEMGDGIVIWRNSKTGTVEYNWFGNEGMRCTDILGLLERMKFEVLKYIEENQ